MCLVSTRLLQPGKGLYAAQHILTSPPLLACGNCFPKLPPLQLMGYCPLTHIAAWLLQLLSLPHVRPRAAAPRMLLLLL